MLDKFLNVDSELDTQIRNYIRSIKPKESVILIEKYKYDEVVTENIKLKNEINELKNKENLEELKIESLKLLEKIDIILNKKR